MKLLTATHDRQGQRDGDFCFTVEGELVLLGFVCASDAADAGGGCGCGRAFAGRSSTRATTTAVVRHLDVSPDDLRLAVEGYYTSAGMGPDVVGAAEFAEMVSETLAELADIGLSLPSGAVVGRRLDRLYWRSEPGRRGSSPNRRGTGTRTGPGPRGRR